MFKKLIPLALAACALAAHADEASIRKAVESKFGGKVESINKIAQMGLYEVLVNGYILYSDEKATTFIAGNIIDAKTMKNLTEERMNKVITKQIFSEMPENAIKQVRGNGKRVLATFEDPNCGYCKRLHKDIQKMDNVTIYTFMLPLLSEDSLKKSRQIWCSADRVRAWNDWMIDNKAPTGKDDCDTKAINKNAEFAQRYRINGTPGLFFADGERVEGAMPLAALEEKLNSKSK